MFDNGESYMRRSTTAALISAILILLLGATVIGVISNQTNATHNDHNDDSRFDNRQSDNCSPITRGLTDHEFGLIKELLEQEHNDNLTRLDILKKLLANATTTEINGTVVSLVKNMLVLNITTDHETIILPRLWTVDTKIMTRTQLFNGTFTATGQEIKVTALKLTLFENQNININILFGFKITNADSMTAFALLPFNIETKT